MYSVGNHLNETPSKVRRRRTGEVQALFEVDSQGDIILTAPVAHLARLAAHADQVVAARPQARTLEHVSERVAAQQGHGQGREPERDGTCT